MTMSRCNVLLAGIGGQGVLTLARAIGTAAVAAGVPVRVGQIYGLSQRGGSVEATVRVGVAQTAFVSAAEADVLLAFEPLEAARALPRVSGDGIVLVNTRPIVPSGQTLRQSPYPDVASIVERLRLVAPHVVAVDASALAIHAAGLRLLGTVMAGLLAGSGRLPFDSEYLRSAIEGQTRSQTVDAHRVAWTLGLEVSSRALADAAAGSRIATGM